MNKAKHALILKIKMKSAVKRSIFDCHYSNSKSMVIMLIALLSAKKQRPQKLLCIETFRHRWTTF